MYNTQMISSSKIYTMESVENQIYIQLHNYVTEVYIKNIVITLKNRHYFMNVQ